MRKNAISYGMADVKWAPETFGCSVYGKRLVLDDPSRFGCLLISGKRKELEDAIKRTYRKTLRKERFVTIGFFVKDSKKYYFTRQLAARADDLHDRLRIFKLFKEYCLDNGCTFETAAVTEGEFIPGQEAKAQKVTILREEVDLKRPLTIRYAD